MPNMPRENICIYERMFFYVCCSDYVGVCGNICCVADVLEDSRYLALECCSMLYVCIRDVMMLCFLFVL